DPGSQAAGPGPEAAPRHARLRDVLARRDGRTRRSARRRDRDVQVAPRAVPEVAPRSEHRTEPRRVLPGEERRGKLLQVALGDRDPEGPQGALPTVGVGTSKLSQKQVSQFPLRHTIARLRTREGFRIWKEGRSTMRASRKNLVMTLAMVAVACLASAAFAEG